MGKIGWLVCKLRRVGLYSWIPVLLKLQIADGQRELIRSFSVKNRHFIGNTSMNAGLSFIMANHAKVKENDLVFDPFVGTGKLVHVVTAFHSVIRSRNQSFMVCFCLYWSQGACWLHVLILERMSVEQILITTLFMAKVYSIVSST